MKRTGSFILAMCLSVGMLAGCGGGKPSDMSQEVYDLGVETCDALDDYIQGKMEQDTCESVLEEIADRAEALEEDASTTDSNALTYIRLAPMSVSSVFVSEGETYKAEDTLNDLKEQLNLK